jgi:hypothetical protein
MNRLTNLALSVGEALVHEGGRLLSGLALGRAKELLGTPEPLGTRQLALNRALQRKTVDGAWLAGPRTGNILQLSSSRYITGDFSPQLVKVSVHEGSRAEVTGFPTGWP